MRINTRMVCVALGLLALSACNTTPPRDADPIGEQWGQIMSLYHALAVYPPTEDFHVGDVLAFEECTQVAEKQANPPIGVGDVELCPDEHGIKVDFDAALAGDLTTYYSKQFVFAGATPANHATKPTAAPAKAPTGTAATPACEPASSLKCTKLALDAKLKKDLDKQEEKIAKDMATLQGQNGSAGKNVKTKSQDASASDDAKTSAGADGQDKSKDIFTVVGTPTTLPIAALPAFANYSAYDASASASLPLGIFNGVFGGGASKSVALSVRFENVTTYGALASHAVKELLTYCATPQQLTAKTSVEPCSEDYLWLLYHAQQRENNHKAMVVAIVDRVYLANQITYSFTKDARSGLSADVKTMLDTLESQQKQAKATGASAAAPSGKPSGQPASASSAGSSVSGQQALQEAQGEATQAASGTVSTGAPSFSVTFGGANGEIVNLTETFARPVAIGYQAVFMAAY